MKIAVAHPDASLVEETKNVLEANDQRIKTVHIAELQQLVNNGHHHYDVVVVDHQLAGERKREFARNIKSLGRDYPVILMLNDENDISEWQKKSWGLYDFVVKKEGYWELLSKTVQKAGEGNGVQTSIKPEKNNGNGTAAAGKNDIGHFICDRKGRFLSVNKTMQYLTGYDEEEMLELSIIDIIPQEDENEFFRKVFDIAQNKQNGQFKVSIIDKLGSQHFVAMYPQIMRDDQNEGRIHGFRAKVVVTEKASTPLLQKSVIDQSRMLSEVMEVIHQSYSEPLNIVLKRVAEITCQLFGFKRSAIALLDRRKHAYVKQAMVGYSEDSSLNNKFLEVQRDVIEKVFDDKTKIKVIYHFPEKHQLQEQIDNPVTNLTNNSQKPQKWHPKDLVLVKLTDFKNNTFGYISLDNPQVGHTPSRSTFYNLELFGKLVSMSLENYYRFTKLERQSRRLKQILVTSNVFKLYYSLNELLKEVVWSVKFSLDFNLVSLVLISQKSGMLETKAVACDNKIKQEQIKSLKYDLQEFTSILKDEYKDGKSYLIKNEEVVFEHLKRIYYGTEDYGQMDDGWPSWSVLLVPIKTRENKIIGFLMADDPADCRIPGKDTVHTLEILANQIAIAIDNRVMYIQAKEQLKSETEIVKQIDPPAVRKQDKPVFPEPPQQPDQEDGEEIDEDLLNADYRSSNIKRFVKNFMR